MPRQRRGAAPTPARSAPSRPTAAPARPAAPAQQQSQPHSTAAHPPQAQQAPPMQQQSAGPGLFGQMASTAAGVAVGSSIGHAIGGFFGGGSSAPAEAQQAPPLSPRPWTAVSTRATPARLHTRTPPVKLTSVTSATAWMRTRATSASAVGTLTNWYVYTLPRLSPFFIVSYANSMQKACQAAAKPY
ncbi:uncharacterized protein N7446_004578 [Penicillium canescens]|uniref:uncharacterized protein n=1 Tax=Penicillium canescens TaxID=5083 RepID=UPI0026DFB201|nr:uncharacterized protein N7446_004578 [Penicillium canescens]KAJ6067541.1 hypothetical protein N7446_004578 [Penicillium canescens]